MQTIRTKLAVAAVLLVGAFGYLAYAGMQKGWVYMVTVEQYATDSQLAKQRVRLHGKVAGENLEVNAAAMSAKFDITGAGHSVAVVYRGAIPDLFAAGRDVVVEGQRASDGIFHADVLMTKCASKYESNSPHGKGKP